MSKRKATSASTCRTGVNTAVKEIATLEKEGFIIEVDESNAKIWQVALVPAVLKFHGLVTLTDKLKVWAGRMRKPTAIVLEIRLAERHPYDPPFVRVLRPRFAARTGHVTIGGSICTQLLTTDGWRPEISVEAVLRCILENMRDGDANIDMSSPLSAVDYSWMEATDAFTRAATVHGWASRIAVE